jgi:TonB-linked SusC/RagA family outer membrane protein
MKKLLLLLLVVMPLGLLAQQKNISGVVTDSITGAQLPYVTILIKGTKQGTISDEKGKFNIKANGNDILVFSYLGSKRREVAVQMRSIINVSLEEDIAQMDEITISVGYYDVRKDDLTGSISQVTSEVLDKNRTNSVEKMLQGQVAGLVVSESSEPGGGIGISIRGTNSMLGGTQPLYVVDGIPISPLMDAQGNSGSGQSQSSLSFLNPNDIEKMEVLKDASATAIYGARGANGVVVITTKSADNVKGTDKISVTVETTLTDVIKNIDVFDGPEFENFMNQRVVNQLYIDITNPNRSGPVFDGTQSITAENFDEVSVFELPYPEATGINTNWQDQVFRKAYSKNYNIAYRGGSKSNNLSISLGLLDNEGVIINSDFKRATFNMNAKRKAFDNRITLLSQTKASYSNGNAASTGNGEIFQQRGVVSHSLSFQPIFPLLELGQGDEIYAELNDDEPISNPYTLAKYVVDIKEAVSVIQSLTIKGEITPNLSATLKGALNYQKSFRDSYYPTNTTRGRRNNGEATQAFLQNVKTYAEANLHYKNNFNGHRVDAIVVGTYENNNIRSMFNKAYGYGSDLTSYYTFESATDIQVPIAGFREQSLLSGLMRVAYNYKGKYYMDVNARMDASSKFAANKKSAIFPSIGLAWRASEEPFLNEVEAISNLKLRFSFGKTGSNPIQPFQSLALTSPIRYNFSDQVVTGYYEENLRNPDLTWETTDQFDVGIDFSMFNSRLNLTVDAYYKKTHDLLQYVNLPASNGYESRVDNFGKVENKGLEFSLGVDLIRKSDFSWNVLGILSINKNKLIELNSNLKYQLGPSVGYNNTFPSMFMEGKPLGVFWGAETEGIYANWQEAIDSGIAGAAPGEIKYVNNYVNTDQDGNPSMLQQINFDDYVQIGDPNPDFTASLSNTVTFKNWDLSVLFTGQKGGDILWVDSWALAAFQRGANGLASAYNSAWIAPLTVDKASGQISYDEAAGRLSNVNNPAPSITSGDRFSVSDRQIFDGSFIRLKNVNLGYTYNIKGTGKSFRLYASAQNLFTWTDYPGFDPEVQSYNKDPQRRGIDFGSYPGTKSYVFGLKFNY